MWNNIYNRFIHNKITVSLYSFPHVQHADLYEKNVRFYYQDHNLNKWAY